MTTNESNKEEQASEGAGIGDNDGATSIIDRAASERERLEKALGEYKKENTRREQLIAKEALGGRSSGAAQQKQPIEISPKEYAKAALKGIILK